MLRFLALALPAALLALASIEAAAVALGQGPDLEPLVERGVARGESLAPALRAAVVAFEAVALVTLFLLVEGASPSPLLDGVLAGFAAWLFRGPLLVATIAAMTRLPTAPFWQTAKVALVALPAAGFAVGWLARARRSPP